MDRIEDYKEVLWEEMEYQATIIPENAPDLKNRLLFNEDETEVILVSFGWAEGYYSYGVLFHFEIIEDKIWLHQNNTDVQIGEILEEKGIPKSTLVVGFVPEYERGMEGYAVA